MARANMRLPHNVNFISLFFLTVLIAVPRPQSVRLILHLQVKDINSMAAGSSEY